MNNESDGVPPEQEENIADEPEADHEAAGAVETELSYEELPGGGHRITRRTVQTRTTTVTEDVDEEIEERLPPQAYRAPLARSHPAPVG